jgi:hypothetical protein
VSQRAGRRDDHRTGDVEIEAGVEEAGVEDAGVEEAAVVVSP